MTRPEGRLLVPVERFAFVPAGATVWDGSRRGVMSALRYPDSGIVVAFDDGTVYGPMAADLSLDLSRPDMVDGVPVRLDALGWALAVLGWKSVTVLPDGTYDNGSRWFPLPQDVADLSDDDASRAVVAAALRGGA